MFTRTRLIAEVAPLLYGHDPAELDPVLDRVIASELVTPLIGVARAVEQPYTATAVLATEHAIANAVERLIDAPGPKLDPARVLAAIAAKQDEIGAELSDGQYQAINAICTAGRAVDVVVGIAGSGKTTALDAATTALEQAGYWVIGTATSGQAARTLGDAAGIEARTMRSLIWQLDHRSIVLDRDCAVILDEAGMTADADMARQRGWLEGDDMRTADGREFAVGDLVVTLAPNYRGQLVTSERGTVTAVDPQRRSAHHPHRPRPHHHPPRLRDRPRPPRPRLRPHRPPRTRRHQRVRY